MLHLFNRVVVGAAAVVATIAALYAWSVTLGLAAPEPALVGPVVAAELDRLVHLQGGVWWATLGGLLVVSVVLAYVALWEIRPRRKDKSPFLIAETPSGLVTIEQRSVVQLVEQVVLALPEVRHVRVRVAHGNGGLWVHCKVSAIPSAIITELGTRVQEVARERIREQLGLEVLGIDAKVNFDALRTERRVLD